MDDFTISSETVGNYCINNNIDAIKSLKILGYNFKINSHLRLMNAIENNHFELFKYLIEECECIPDKGPLEILFMDATCKDNVDIIKYFVEKLHMDPKYVLLYARPKGFEYFIERNKVVPIKNFNRFFLSDRIHKIKEVINKLKNLL